MSKTVATLHHEVAATAIHPLTGSPLWQCRLATGTQIESAANALQKAEAQGIDAVLVRVLEPDGCMSLARLASNVLRDAIRDDTA